MKTNLPSTAFGFVAAALASIPVYAQNVTGAGASFPAPLYAKWAGDFNKATGTQVNYQSVGSGAGIKQIEAKTVDFGASDMPLSDEDLKAKGLMQFPTVIGGVIPVVNIAGVKPGDLKLNGTVLADIYLGKITKWNDPAIKALNGSLALPDAAIAPVRRADGSGTSAIFTNYLTKVSAEWKEKAGEGTTVQWPVGLGGKGNEGVSAFVQRLAGSIGYVEYAYAKQNKLAHVQMRNAAGSYVQPDEKTVQAAAAGWGEDGNYDHPTNQKGAASWPITGATYIIVYKTADKPQQATEVMKFFDWAYKNGDKMALELDYVPMPDTIVNQVQKSWGQVKDGAGKAVWSAR